jgi:UDP-N-acetyl-D-glucosamine dehydrogenase
MILEPHPSVTELADLIATRRAEVCVIGLGYVGLPLAVSLAEAVFSVRGLDVAAD